MNSQINYALVSKTLELASFKHRWSARVTW